jgi:hypothetical protein
MSEIYKMEMCWDSSGFPCSKTDEISENTNAKILSYYESLDSVDVIHESDGSVTITSKNIANDEIVSIDDITNPLFSTPLKSISTTLLDVMNGMVT